MSKLKLKMNQRYPQAHDSGSTEFDSHQADKHFDFSDEFEGVNDEKDDDAEDGIEPQLIFTTPDVRNIGSFTPTPRPKPTKKPKNAITPVGVSHAYRPANYSYRRNNNHRKSTHPYSSVETTESYDNLYDHRLQATLPQPPAYDREEDNDEYGNSKEGLGNYHSGHNHKDTPLNGDPFPSYPRHKGYETPPNYFSTPSGPPSSKPKVKQKPNPPPDQADDEEEYYEEDNAQDDNYDQRKQNVDDNDNDNENEGDDEYYGEGYDDEEYAEDYKHERPTQLNGTRARPPRPPKMMQNAKQRGKQPLISSNNSKSGDDDEYYYDDYYDDDEYYDDVTTNKVTQPSTRHKSNVTMDPAISSSIDAYTVLKTSPAYRKSKTFPAANRTEPEHTSPLADVTSTSRPNQVSTTPRYFIKPKMRKKTTPHQSEIPAPKSNLTTPSTPTLHYPRKFNRLKNKLNATLPMTPKVRTENVTQTNNVTMPPKHRKNRPKYKNYPMRNRTTPIVQNTTPESPLEGAQSNRPPLKDASLEGAQSNRNQQKDTSLEGAQSNRNQLKATSLEGAQSNRNQLKDTSLEGAQSNRTPLTQTEAPENHKFGGKARHKNHRAQTTEATRPPPPSLPTQKIQKSTPHTFSSPAKHQEADTDEYIPANHKPQPAGRPLTNTRGSASHKPNQKQPQKFTYSPPSGEATDRVSVAPPNYVQQQQAPVHVASAGVANRGIYNGTQYNPSQQQFDSYYNLYNDESELYGDDDYGQYHVSSRGKPQIEIVQRLPEKNAVAYTPVQSYKQQENAYTPSYKTQGNVAYTPSYKQQSSDIYNVDDYNQQYNLQGADDDLSYQPGIIANKPSIRLVGARNESKANESNQQHVARPGPGPIPPKPHELAQLPSQRITLSAAFALETSPKSKPSQSPPFSSQSPPFPSQSQPFPSPSQPFPSQSPPFPSARRPANFFIVKENDTPSGFQKADEITDEFAVKKEIKNIDITRMRASGKGVPARETPKLPFIPPTFSPTLTVSIPRKPVYNSSAFSTDDNGNFRIIVDPSLKSSPSPTLPPVTLGLRYFNVTPKFIPTPASVSKEIPRGTFKPRPFAQPEWIDTIDLTSTSARPTPSPESSNHRFERVNFEKEVAELSRSNPTYQSFTKPPVQFTTEASTSRIAIKIPQRLASKSDQSTKKIDVTNTVGRFISDLSFTTKKPDRPLRVKSEENDVQRFTTAAPSVSRFWSSPKTEATTAGKTAYPPKYEFINKPTETPSVHVPRSFSLSKDNPPNLNANKQATYNIEKKPSKFDENLDEEEYYDDEYYEDEEEEEEKPLIAPRPSSTQTPQAPAPASTSQLPPQPAPFTYKPTIKLPISSIIKEYSPPSKSGSRIPARDNEVNNAKETALNPCSEPNSECNEKPLSRGKPVTITEESPASLDSPRGRHRGSATYTTVSSDSDRGSLSGGRPTLKPSTSIVSKTSDYYDIYRFPPRRPEAVYPTPQVDKTAAKCRKDVCLLPDCYCGGKDIPGDLTPEETPQIVLLTFDDSVNDLNKGLYSDLFEKGRTNPNGCPISATFYVSHEWTDYSQVQNLYATGHEIASHSVSHSFGEQFSQKKWTREIAGQREILAAYGGVKLEDIRGMRAPFLAVGGNKMFKMLYDSNFTYDSSMPVYENRPPSWPYTFDYKIFHDCMIPPCPTRSYPGVWEVPMVMWQDLNGGRCSMGDACSNPPTADGVYKMLVKNFERHFTTNRAPLGLFYHAAWFTQPHHKEGFIAFLDTIVNMPEVWVVTNWQALQWVRDPTPISRLRNFTPFGCDYPDRPRKCNNPKVCNLWHKSGVRYMRTCQPCPDIYPWTGKTGIKNSKVDNEIIQE
ncbi:unnamed protein product [Bemisia tabaci]|uniref:NodB homology domain-containing protein n=1 Tax=Bemisia tabaci TaxID=7038 RepID=A0A9P0AHM7_BEMTA|nr:unnamed protein product [Bemisia tabaci]